MAGLVRTRAAAVIIQEDAILLVLHRKGESRYYLLPGGGVEQGESEGEALERELLEETGLTVSPLRLLFETHSRKPAGEGLVQRVYFCRAQGKIRPSTDPRVAKSEYVKKQDFAAVTFYPNIKKEILAAWDAGFGNAPFKKLTVKWE